MLGLDGSAVCGDAAVSPKALPHSMQNLAFGGFSVPHESQTTGSADPQDMQNFAPAGFSVPQLGQLPEPMGRG